MAAINHTMNATLYRVLIYKKTKAQSVVYQVSYLSRTKERKFISDTNFLSLPFCNCHISFPIPSPSLSPQPTILHLDNILCYTSNDPGAWITFAFVIFHSGQQTIFPSFSFLETFSNAETLRLTLTALSSFTKNSASRVLWSPVAVCRYLYFKCQTMFIVELRFADSWEQGKGLAKWLEQRGSWFREPRRGPRRVC